METVIYMHLCHWILLFFKSCFSLLNEYWSMTCFSWAEHSQFLSLGRNYKVRSIQLMQLMLWLLISNQGKTVSIDYSHTSRRSTLHFDQMTNNCDGTISIHLYKTHSVILDLDFNQQGNNPITSGSGWGIPKFCKGLSYVLCQNLNVRSNQYFWTI